MCSWGHNVWLFMHCEDISSFYEGVRKLSGLDFSFDFLNPHKLNVFGFGNEKCLYFYPFAYCANPLGYRYFFALAKKAQWAVWKWYVLFIFWEVCCVMSWRATLLSLNFHETKKATWRSCTYPNGGKYLYWLCFILVLSSDSWRIFNELFLGLFHFMWKKYRHKWTEYSQVELIY